jgi:hypothetical protein
MYAIIFTINKVFHGHNVLISQPVAFENVSVDVWQKLLNHQVVIGRHVNSVGGEGRSDSQFHLHGGRYRRFRHQFSLVPNPRNGVVLFWHFVQRFPVACESISGKMLMFKKDFEPQ